MTTKTCARCSESLLISSFPVRANRNGSTGGWCKECHRVYFKNYYRENKKKHQAAVRRYQRAERAVLKPALDRLKAGTPCADCLRSFNPLGMDFDHVRGTKRMQISDANLSCTKTLLVELRKCELVCAVCHRVRTGARKLGEPCIAGQVLDLSEIEALIEAKTARRVEQHRHKRKSAWAHRPPRYDTCPGCDKQKDVRSVKCQACYQAARPAKIDWPPADELHRRVSAASYRKVAKELGVTDNAVRKHLKTQTL